MPWAGFIDELKGWASYDISEWIVASAILTLVATKSLKNIFGQLQELGAGNKIPGRHVFVLCRRFLLADLKTTSPISLETRAERSSG